MKRIAFHLLFVVAFLSVSCQKAPELALSSPTSIDVSANGGTSTITFTTNCDWTVRSSELWVTVSPTSGTVSDDGTATVEVNCSANTTYEPRSATVTITVEDLTQTVTINQPANLGMIVPNKLFEVTGKSTIVVEVQSNVNYVVSISDDWITFVGTKGLVSDKLVFNIDDNDTYDARSGTITIKALEGDVPEQVIAVKQAQKDAILIGNTSYDMPYGGGEIQVKVQANVDFDVKSEVNWIHYVGTKALSNSTVRLTIDENGTYNVREGKVRISQRNGSLSYVITVKQAGRIAVTSVSLDRTKLTLEIGDTETLVATVKPNNATDKSVSWSTSNPSVATVNNGKVTAVSVGTATISAIAGNKQATCTVTCVSAPVAVDLGLSVKWASFNVGASKPENRGDFYAWGETSTKSNYSWSTYKWGNGGQCKLNKYCVKSYQDYWDSGEPDGKSFLDLEDDAAYVNLGGNWRTPTKEEWDELRTKCTWTWTTQNGINGYLVSRNGNSIFLPAVGYYSGNTYYNDYYGDYYYQSSSSWGDIYTPVFCFTSTYYDTNVGVPRSLGLAIRPVCGKYVEVSSISLSKSSVNVRTDDKIELTATISPNNATGKRVYWYSSNKDVIDGLPISSLAPTTVHIWGKKPGSTTISAYSSNGLTASCVITVLENNTPVAVDLGLPSGIKWASCNIGASNSEEYGNYYAWGETETKSNYSWSTYKWCNGSDNSLTKYNTSSSYGTVDNKTKLENSDDVARVKLGGKWRMPTDAEWTELRTKCSWTWTTQNGVYGRKVTGPNGNSIFLPAAGYRSGTSLYKAGSRGIYWSSSLDTGYPGYAWAVYFYSEGGGRGSTGRYDGFSVRPVYGDIVSVTSVSLNETSLSLYEGEAKSLVATISPSNAVDKSVTWSSSNTSVATVSGSGVVEAIKAGSATITVRTNDGGKTATCSVTVKVNSGQHTVDLGLPSGLKWGSCNIGASKPEEYGDYYAWGETSTKSKYDWSTYIWCNGSGYSLTKYNTSSSYGTVDNKTKLDNSDDVARVKLGGKWRMPTDAECTELVTKCTWTWTTQNGVKGGKVTGPNGNSIFLPAAGYRYGTSLDDAGSYGFYWSSSLDTDDPVSAWRVHFNSRKVYKDYLNRDRGYSIRPVSD